MVRRGTKGRSQLRLRHGPFYGRDADDFNYCGVEKSDVTTYPFGVFLSLLIRPQLRHLIATLAFSSFGEYLGAIQLETLPNALAHVRANFCHEKKRAS